MSEQLEEKKEHGRKGKQYKVYITANEALEQQMWIVSNVVEKIYSDYKKYERYLVLDREELYSNTVLVFLETLHEFEKQEKLTTTNRRTVQYLLERQAIERVPYKILGITSERLRDIMELDDVAEYVENDSIENQVYKEMYYIDRGVSDEIDMRGNSIELRELESRIPLSIQCLDENNLVVDFDPENYIEKREYAEIIKKALNTLSERQKNILIRRFGLEGNAPLTLSETARYLTEMSGSEKLISNGEIRNSECKALRGMRSYFRGQRLEEL